jgi:flagellar biosynthesis protein FliR
VAAFVGMGISRLFISVVCAAALWRYRSAIPVIFGLLAMHDVARELVLHQVRVGTPIGPIVNVALVLLTLAGLALSVGSGRGERTRVEPMTR